MNQLLSRITSLGKSGWENLGFAQKAEKILSDGFNLSAATEISEVDLEKIFAYRITPDTLPFFIISNQGASMPKRKFKVDNESDDTEICYDSHWFAMIRPNDSSNIIIPSEKIWIRFDSKKQFTVTESDHRVWGLGGGIFQLDKNLGKEIVHTQVDIGSMLGILDKISHTTI